MPAQRIAIIGASSDRRKFGNKAVRAYLRAGWEVFPVNLHETTIEGQQVYPTLSDVPQPIDRVTFYVPPRVGAKLLPAVKEVNVADFILNPGTEDDALLAVASRLGLSPRQSCSIVEIGARPSEFPDR